MTGATTVSRDVPAPPEALACDGCSQIIIGEPSGWGVYLWVRGDERREERAPLCEQCASAIAASTGGLHDDDEEG